MNQIAVNLQRESYLPGQVVKGRVIFEINKPVKARAMFLEIVGFEDTHYTVSTGKNSHTVSERNYILNKKIYLRLPRKGNIFKIEPGKYINEFECAIPDYAPSSYYGIHAKIMYWVDARVNVQWWSDFVNRELFYVFKRKRDLKPFSRPISFQSKNYVNPKNDKPGFYVTLPRRAFKPGESIEGTIQLCNMDACRIRKVLIRLVGEELARVKGHHEYFTIESREIKLSPEGWVNETPVEFQIPISRKISPSYRAMRSKLRWYVEAQLDLPLKSDIRAWCPVEIDR